LASNSSSEAAGIAHLDLAGRIAAGDRQAETEFVQQFERGVRVLMRRHCRPSDPCVEDLVQDVLAGVIERLRAGAIRDAAALPGYVQAAVVHTASAEYRRRRPTEPIASLMELADGADPPSTLDAQQLSAVLRDLLGDLPVTRDRELLKRFYLDEEDKDSVCRDLGIEVQHFHRVVFRARERFRALIEKAGMGEPR